MGATSAGDVAEALGTFAAGLELDGIPEQVRGRMRLLALDAIGVTIAAAALTEARPVSEYIASLGGAPEARALGVEHRLPARSAAYVNAWLGDLLDFEDTQKFGGNHPGATMVPAALAVGERQGCPGRELVVAMIAGYEIANRIARGVFPSSTLRGFLSTGASGTLGAAATASRLLGLDAAQTAHSLRIAGFLLPISAADTLWEGESAKPSHAAQAAATGIDAAMLAARGYTAAPLEGGVRALGYLSMIAEHPDTEAIVAGLGTDFTLMDLAFKAYPACGYTNGAIDAAIAIHRRLGPDVARIERITVSSYRLAVIAVPRSTSAASTFTACQFSLPYTVAAALLDGDFGVAQLLPERRSDPTVHELAQRVEVIEDPAMTAAFPARLPYRVAVVIDGATVSEDVDAPLGTAQNPMTDAMIRDKYRGLAGAVVGADRASVIETELEHVESLASFTWPELGTSR